MPSASAVLVKLPSQLPNTRAMNRFSNSRTASSNCTPRSTISSTSRSSRSEIMAAPLPRGCLSTQVFAGQPAECLDIPVAGARHDVVGQARDRGLFVPPDALEIIADELLVEARLGTAGLVLVARPESRRVGGQHFIDQNQALRFGTTVVGQEPEFELRVGHDDALRFGMGG